MVTETRTRTADTRQQQGYHVPAGTRVSLGQGYEVLATDATFRPRHAGGCLGEFFFPDGTWRFGALTPCQVAALGP